LIRSVNQLQASHNNKENLKGLGVVVLLYFISTTIIFGDHIGQFLQLILRPENICTNRPKLVIQKMHWPYCRKFRNCHLDNDIPRTPKNLFA